MIHSKKLTAILGSCALVTAVGVMPTAVAANDAGQHQPPVIEAQAEEQFDDATIDAFAAAQMRVAEIRALYAAQFEAAETDEERMQGLRGGHRGDDRSRRSDARHHVGRVRRRDPSCER